MRTNDSVPERAGAGNGGGDADGVVESQAQGLVDFFATFAAVEEVLLDVVADREERAAGGVRCDVSVGASHPADECA